MQIGFGVATRIVLLLGLVVAIGARSQAAPILVEVRSDGALVQSWNSAALSCAVIVPGVEGCGITNQAAGDFTIRQLNLTLRSQAIVNANLAVDATDLATDPAHRLTVDIILTVPATGPTTGVSGTLAGSYTDGITPDPGNDIATIAAPAGSSIYTALLDNAFYDSMRDDPFTAPNTTTSATLSPTNFGLPNPPGQAGPPVVASTITLRFDFLLTGRDQAGLQGSLRLTPEPGTAMLLGLGLVGLAMAGRRR